MDKVALAELIQIRDGFKELADSPRGAQLTAASSGGLWGLVGDRDLCQSFRELAGEASLLLGHDGNWETWLRLLAKRSGADEEIVGISVPDGAMHSCIALRSVSRRSASLLSGILRRVVAMPSLADEPVPPQVGEPVIPPLDADLPALDSNDMKILKALREKHPQLASQYDLEAATFLCRRTISRTLKNLQCAQLVCRPKGERKGSGLTPSGLRIAQDCAQIAQ